MTIKKEIKRGYTERNDPVSRHQVEYFNNQLKKEFKWEGGKLHQKVILKGLD